MLGFEFQSRTVQSRAVCPPQESELLRLKAFLLFRKLAKVARASKKRFFKEEVKRAWVPLMLHCQDPCPDAARVRLTPRALPTSGPLAPEGNCFWAQLAAGSPCVPETPETTFEATRQPSFCGG